MNILIVDDHALIREGVRRVLEGRMPNCFVADVASGPEALALLGQQPFDLVIVDLAMPHMNGLQFAQRARREFPQLQMLLLSLHAEEQYALRAFKAGVNGYITKDCTPEELTSAVRKVGGGGQYVSGGLAERMVLHLNRGVEPLPHARLSDREFDIMCRLVSGQRIAEIADALHISAKTVSTHKSRILDRLQLPNTAALIRYGILHRLATESAWMES